VRFSTRIDVIGNLLPKKKKTGNPQNRGAPVFFCGVPPLSARRRDKSDHKEKNDDSRLYMPAGRFLHGAANL
jgi:hypothetical protein